MSPPRNEPDVARRLLDVAARLLATEGAGAVSARRLAKEVGSSTMAVYTHFGGMDELLAQVRREGFRRFGAALDASTRTDDPVADWMVLGWAYRRFAIDEPHLYRAMFGDVDRSFAPRSDEEAEEAIATFLVLLGRIERCSSSGRWQVRDLTTTAEACWGLAHGLAGMELTGYFAAKGRDPLAVHEENMRTTSAGHGDDADAVEESLSRARRRARRSGLL